MFDCVDAQQAPRSLWNIGGFHVDTRSPNTTVPSVASRFQVLVEDRRMCSFRDHWSGRSVMWTLNLLGTEPCWPGGPGCLRVCVSLCMLV